MVNKRKLEKCQIGIHVAPGDRTLLAMVDRADTENLPYALVGRSAMEIAWEHFPNEVLARAKDRAENGYSIGKWATHLKEENERLKKRLDELQGM